jgi:myo-inositol 2-dehydrogenase/D-chiro-inositol 1-dehydrogenase
MAAGPLATRIGVALFGVGRAGSIHFLNLLHNPQAELIYVAEQGEGFKRAEDLLTTHHLSSCRVVDSTDPQRIYEDPRVEAVVVCAPTFEHEAIVRAALRHGKAVFCEKPISQEEGGTQACYEEAERAGKPLFCSFNRRFDPSCRQLRSRALAGEVGAVHVVKTCSRDSPLPAIAYLKISGGIFHDCAVHDIDLVCWVLGARPTVVHAFAHAHNPHIAAIDDVDTVLVSMKFSSGALATIDLSRHAAYGYDQRLEVFGSKGMLVSENQRATALTSLGASGTHRDVILHSFPQRYADSYVQAMQHFLNVVRGTEALEITKSDAVDVSSIATACEQSFRTGLPVHPTYHS